MIEIFENFVRIEKVKFLTRFSNSFLPPNFVLTKF